MPQIKDTVNLAQIKSIAEAPESPLYALLDFAEGKKSKSVFKRLRAVKSEGYCPAQSVFLMLLMPFIGAKSIHYFCKSVFSNITQAAKDVFYRIKNNPGINWRKLLYDVNDEYGIVEQSEPHRGSAINSPRCFIIDDSLSPKEGKQIEGMSMVHDHVNQTWTLGYKNLCLGLFEAGEFRPLDYSLHRERGSKQSKPFGLKKKVFKAQFRKPRPSRSPGHARKKELDSKKTDNALELLNRAAQNGYSADYVLVDSWFTNQNLIKGVKANPQLGELLGQCKMDKRKYTLGDCEYSIHELRQKFRGKWKRCRKFKMRYIRIEVEYKGVRVVLFITRLHNSKKERLILSTDTTLSFIKAFEIYAIRWSIEVFFKEAKQYLHFGKCQSNDFDAQIADMTLVMIRYVILAHYKRKLNYSTLGGLFKDWQEKTMELLLNQKILNLVTLLLKYLGELFDIDWHEMTRNLIRDDQLNYQIQGMVAIIAKIETEPPG